MYKCQECGCVFDEPEKFAEDCTPGGAFEGGSFINYWEGCPNCAGDFEEYDEEDEKEEEENE